MKIIDIKEEHYSSDDEGVYIIQVNEFYKIGFTKNFKNRLETFRNANPYPIKLVLFFVCENPYEKEQKLHEIFSPKRMHREWFKLDKEDLFRAADYIKEFWDEPKNGNDEAEKGI